MHETRRVLSMCVFTKIRFTNHEYFNKTILQFCTTKKSFRLGFLPRINELQKVQGRSKSLRHKTHQPSTTEKTGVTFC